MYQPAELEQRLSDLQSQVERLSVSVQTLNPPDRAQPSDRQFSQLTERWTEILDRFTTTGQRHSKAVGELEERVAEWQSIEDRIQHDATAQLSDLHRAIEQEWTALRQIHTDPVKELKEQAASLRDVCVATATAAASGFDRAEARLAALETDLREQLASLSEQVKLAVVELRSQGLAQHQAAALPAAAWPLDGVMRVHSQFREGAQTDEQAQQLRATAPAALPVAAEVETKVEPEQPTSMLARVFQVGMGLCVIVALVAVIFSQREAGKAAAQAAAAERRARTAITDAEQRMAATRAEAAKEMATARDSAIRAQTTSDVLAAPDLVRFPLAGVNETQRSTGQLLWSRSRGYIFSGSRLPAAPPNTEYQIWLLTNSAPVSAGTFVPDQAGRVTLVFDTLPPVPRPVVGVTVTAELKGGSPQPGSNRLLASPE